MQLKPRAYVYDSYWYFATERQNIFYRKLNHQESPYTDYPILSQYKFCNVYRACDRVSQYLIKNVIYGNSYSKPDTLFRIFLFRLFNKTETWELLEQKLGKIYLENFDPEVYASIIEEFKIKGGIIYGNAFILCANKAFGYKQKHRNHLALLKMVFTSNKYIELLNSRSLKELFMILQSLPLIGDFMAYQIATDLNYSSLFNFSENSFTVAGPGAKRGIEKIFQNTGHYSYEDIIMWMVDNQDVELSRLGLSFKCLGGRKLKAIDCQGLFCEIDKYCRVKFPELASNRIRIKSKYKKTDKPIKYFFPPKWDIELFI